MFCSAFKMNSRNQQRTCIPVLQSKIPVFQKSVKSASNLFAHKSAVVPDSKYESVSTLKNKYTNEVVPKSVSMKQKSAAVKISSNVGIKQKPAALKTTSKTTVAVSKRKTSSKEHFTSTHKESLRKKPDLHEPRKNHITSKETFKSRVFPKATNGDKPERKDVVSNSTCEKENISSPQHKIDQKEEIKFEANEYFRSLILNSRELSPGILKHYSGTKLSNIKESRHSAYQPFEVSSDPYRDIMKAIENRKFSLIAEQKIKLGKPQASPSFKRSSVYATTPYSTVKDPYQEALKSIKALRAAKNMKSSKKVTFSLIIKEYSPPRSSNESAHNDSIPISITKEKEEIDHSVQMKKTELVASVRKETAVPNVDLIDSLSVLSVQEKPNAERTSTPPSPLLTQTRESKLYIENIVNNFQTRVSALSNAGCEPLPTALENVENSKCDLFHSPAIVKKSSKICFDKPSKSLLNNFLSKNGNVTTPRRETTIQNNKYSELTNKNNPKNGSSIHGKIYTPLPVSFYSQSKITTSSSPEFLNEGLSKIGIGDYAPIHTPLVLKNIARCSEESDEDLSPVRMKLNFADIENGLTADKKSHSKAPLKQDAILTTLQSIPTAQKWIDYLADQECSILLSHLNSPKVCGRYLQNPIAVILNEGDETHFVPIELECS